MKIISIFNQKGGVGKTTTNINLSAFIAAEGYKVLTIDLDPQGNTTSGLGIDKTKLINSTYDLIGEEDVDINDTIIKSDLVKNLYVIPSKVELAAVDIEIASRKDREFILKNKLKNLKDFDYVFIDCPPSLGFLTINALTASDSVLIPIQCEFYSLEGVGQLINTIQLVKKSLNKNIEIEGVLLSMLDYRANLSLEVVKEVKKYFKDKVYDTFIPRNIKLAEAPSFGLPILLYDPKCKGSTSYEKLSKEFIEKQSGVN